jgi:predicted PurR-regulated permease PerM
VETGIRPRKDQPTKMDFAHRVLIGAGIVIALILTILLLITTIRVWLLIFFGILIAVFLRGVSDWVSRWSRLPERLCLTLVILALAGLIGLSVWLLSPHVTEQVNSLSRGMLRAMGQVKDFLDKYLGAAQILGTAEKPGKMIGEFGGLFTRLGEFFSVTMAALTGAVVVFFAALYFAFNPSLYIRGIVKLIPVGYRESALEVIRTLGFTLKWWLIGRASMMVIVGILSGVGLWLLQIPLALTLGILAGLLTFIPYFGPLVSAIPAILMALLVDFSHALYVVLLYVGIHTLEGYVLSPLIQGQTIYLPPMLMLAALIGMGILLGIPGLIISTPLTAIVSVLIKKVYIEGLLGDRTDAAD